MKTSNKVLTGFVALVFIVPFLLASVLKSKIKAEKYTIVKNENRNPWKAVSRPLGPVKVLDIAASNPDLIHCRIKEAPLGSYAYRQYNDSLAIYQNEDTLFIRHPSMIVNGDKQRLLHFEIDVSLPRLEHLVADGASVFVDSVSTPLSGFTVKLKNGAIVADARNK